MIEAFERWSPDPALVGTGGLALSAELAELAEPEVEWSDPCVVERLVRTAAHVEAFSMLQPTPIAEDPHVGAALATSLFAVYLRENWRVDCAPYLSTFPSRISEAEAQLGSMPEEAANELAFSAAMAVSALK